MALPRINPTTTEAWKKLSQHYQKSHKTHLKDFFGADKDRFSRFSVRWKDFLVDYSKNRITEEIFQSLIQLAEEVGLKEAMAAYYGGSVINETEERAVLHTALRYGGAADLTVGSTNATQEIEEVKKQINTFCGEVISGSKKGFTGKQFTDVVNIGIGGSDLGPVMIVEALAHYHNHLKVHFMSNVDGDHVAEVLKGLNPETTLFIVVSKSFTTQETLSNAMTVKDWFLTQAKQADVAKHFVAVSTNLEQIKKFGIAEENVFPMWDWVGGRFSLWSAVGLSVALAVGYSNFEALLEGAFEMDTHFKEANFSENIPVILALLSVWYNNFYGAETEAIIPYSQYLHRLPAYLQQAIMESNGKGRDRKGDRIDYQTGTIIWGEPGTNSQHAFFQLIHQGTKLIPSDFIGFVQPLNGNKDHHDKLMANFFAQTEALMNGKTGDEVKADLASSNISKDQLDKLVPFKIFEGNRPTNTLLIKKLTPKNLGALIAMYEHKIFVQGVIWNIFSYDQWGVELGKQLAKGTLSDIQGATISEHDGSTTALLEHYKG